MVDLEPVVHGVAFAVVFWLGFGMGAGWRSLK
jgi:hypothetical protein